MINRKILKKCTEKNKEKAVNSLFSNVVGHTSDLQKCCPRKSQF